MLKILLARLRQGHRTIAYPDGPPPPMPDRFRGVPRIDSSKCPEGCKQCVDACPTDALLAPLVERGPLRVDLGRCIFCTDCVQACPEGAVSYGADWRLATRTREDLVVEEGRALKLAEALEGKLLALFGRSLKLREVSAGGCVACDLDANVLNTVGWDLGRFGIQFVASPRHADGLLITGAVTENMKVALEKTYAAVPDPKIVIALGTCAISGGIFAGRPEVHSGATSVVPVDLFIPGCPPHPLTILDGLLRLLGRIDDGSRVPR